MFYVYLTIFAAAIVAVDQWTKALAIAADAAGSLPSKSILGIFHISLLPGGNKGGMWGLFEGQTWLFILVMVAFLALLVVMVWKKWVTKKFEWVCLAAIAGGGIGNMIDRIFRGYVVDMFDLQFMDYPIFNLADIFVVVGVILGAVYYLWFYDKYDKRSGKEPGDDTAADSHK